MSVINDLFNKLILIQTKFALQLKSKADVIDGNLDDSLAYSFAKQKTEHVSSASISFNNITTIYKLDISSNTTLTFDTTNLDNVNNSYVFEVWINLQDVYTITFPSNVVWLELPDMSEAKLYCFTFRILPEFFTDVKTVSSPQIIANLAYSHAITLA